jgi:hypothetical protein
MNIRMGKDIFAVYCLRYTSLKFFLPESGIIPLLRGICEKKPRMDLSGLSYLRDLRGVNEITLKEIATILVQDIEVYYDGN